MSSPTPPAGPPPRQYYGRRRRGVVWPVLLIAIGVVLLLQNFGLLSWQIWGSVWRLWPLILVLIGLELFLGGSARGLTSGLIVLVLVAGLVWAGLAGAFGRFTGDNGPAETHTATQSLQDASSASVMVRFGAGTLNIGPLHGDSGQLAQMTYEGPAPLAPRASYRVRNGQGFLTYTTRGGGPPFRLPFTDHGGGQMELLLTPAVPLNLDVQEGASDSRVDLRELRVSTLQLQTGASHINLILPEHAGTTAAAIKGGAATVEVEVPQGVGAHIQYEGGLSTLNVDQTRFSSMGERTYQSADYDSAANKVDLTIQTGVATISVR